MLKPYLALGNPHHKKEDVSLRKSVTMQLSISFEMESAIENTYEKERFADNLN